MATVCLCMIVKNESAVIRRALASAIPHIDHWLICDTGSTDGTQDIIRETLKDIPGELVEVPWVNFGVNRTQALGLAAELADYLLILDADSAISVSAPFKDKLTGDAYEFRYQGDLDYSQTFLVSTRHVWRYVGAVHEYITSETARANEPLPEITMVNYNDGGTRHVDRTETFLNDARLLHESVLADPSNARDTFYLAQTYKDLGRWADALYWYEKRVELGGWQEECFYAMYQMGRMQAAMGIKWDQVLATYLRAHAYRPWRLEPVYEIARHYREEANNAAAFTFAATWGYGFPYPTDRLFIDKTVYEIWMPFEFAFNALHSNRPVQAQYGLRYLNGLKGIPQWMQDFVTIHLDNSESALTVSSE